MTKLVSATGVIIALGLLFLAPSVSPASTLDQARWEKDDIPAEGENGGWLLAEGSDIKRLVMTAGGTLYAGVSWLPSALQI